MNGFPRRGLKRWIACATSSLPVPLSPSIITVLETGAICSILSSTSLIASDCPISPVASVSRLRSRILRTVRYSSAADSGLVYTSVNPIVRSRSRSCGSSTSASPITPVPFHNWSRTTCTLAGSPRLPVRTTKSGLKRLISPRRSSSGDTTAVLVPAASSRALSLTAGSTSVSVIRTFILAVTELLPRYAPSLSHSGHHTRGERLDPAHPVRRARHWESREDSRSGYVRALQRLHAPALRAQSSAAPAREYARRFHPLHDRSPRASLRA